MTIRVALHHVTHYVFDRPVSLSPHEIRLRPAAHSRTPVESYSLKIAPAKHFLNWQQDPYGNWLARAVFPDKTTELKIEVDLVADMTVINPFDFFVEKYADTYPFDYPAELKKELAPYLEMDEPGPLLAQWLKDAKREVVDTTEGSVNMLVALNQRLQRDVRYLIRMEPGVQAPEVTLSAGQGSCRDTGWLLVQAMRHFGIAARFASGYLIQLVADVKALDGPSGTTVDFTDLHAWAEAYVPGAGWIGLDPTSGLLTGEGHIPLACAAVPTSAAPVIGMTDVCQTALRFEMKVTRIHEDPRVTRPYTEEQWADINALGERIDGELTKEKVKLTMGGEPTFVSVDDMDGPEWNYAALSPKKLELSIDLLHRLRPKFAPGSLVHFGQGKWYPGEPLPRWALSCWWRPDGEAVWQDESLVAWTPGKEPLSASASRIFATAVAEAIGLHADFVQPAFEDPWRVIRDETRMAINVDPLTANIRDSAERQQLAAQLAGGIGEPVGHVLPLKAASRAKANAPTVWMSNLWPLRAGHIFLVEGTSPMGLRLPLAALPKVAPKDEDLHPPVDPYEARETLPARPKAAPATTGKQPAQPTRKALKVGESAVELVRTAACFEVRDNCLYVFLPPLPSLEDYLRLLHTVEEVARTMQIAVRIEGYAPPDDPRIRKFAITPDPGVIEVNIHPARTWRELADNTQILYDEARQSRLGTEKFQLDGRHTGTGGGNHVTVGGATPAESPLLRRPDLLRSLITYWQNHPALSYLFSGMFIGPTSQSPRVDEARDDNLYELEIAFEQLEAEFGALAKQGKENDRPWLVDRLLRNFLIDLTGNTHRAEFSIDKLYSPDGPTGRLGLLEFRAFEMPPHSRMSLAQMLLLRALIIRFWKQPYRARLVNWGTELHDRFMLPYFVAADMKAVVEDLQHAGYDFRYEWFAPFIEFRFPRYGTVAYQGIELELRQAIEPWHVLGEEMAGTSTARYVDSSVERMQVKVTGMIGLRHAVACNGRIVPLAPTGVPGEFVAGVRYRAWLPPSALHPTIGVHSPLSFDLVDTWTGRSIGGCTYHVSHPGGRNYGTFPVNAFEAEARRVARFQKMGHTPGPMKVQPEARNPAFPFTLDLRKRADSPLG